MSTVSRGLTEEKRRLIGSVYRGEAFGSGGELVGGAFMSPAKIKQGLKQIGVRNISMIDIKKYLNSLPSYYQFKPGRKVPNLPRHAADRFGFYYKPNYVWFLDSMYLRFQGWRGKFKFVLGVRDGFTRKAGAWPMVKLTADSVVKAFQNISKTYFDGQLPDIVFTDRGSENVQRFSAFLHHHGIKQIFSNAQNRNKSYLAENLFRTLRMMLKRQHEEGQRDLKKALKIAVDTLNNTPADVNLTPEEAAKPQNFATVTFRRQKRRIDTRHSYRNQYEKLNAIFSVGAKVRRRIFDQSLYRKEAVPKWSRSLFTIREIIPSEPLLSYRIVDEKDRVQPGTYTVFDLISAE